MQKNFINNFKKEKYGDGIYAALLEIKKLIEKQKTSKTNGIINCLADEDCFLQALKTCQKADYDL